MEMSGNWSASNISDYTFGGKELNGDFGLNMLDYGARQRDGASVLWWQVDPLADSYTAWSPYNYAFNNPIRLSDPSGMSPEDCCGGLLGVAYSYLADKVAGAGHERLAGILDVAAGMDMQYAAGQSGRALASAKTTKEKVQALDPTGLTSLPETISAAINGDERAQGQLIGGAIAISAGGKSIKSTSKSNTVRVGRWMSEKELAKMKETGKVQEGAGGQTYGSTAGPNDFKKTAKKGSLYVEYDVDNKSVITPAGKKTWVKTLGNSAPKSQKHRLKKQGGSFNPSAKNIKIKDKK